MGTRRTVGARRPAVTHGPADIVQVCALRGEPFLFKTNLLEQHTNSILVARWGKACAAPSIPLAKLLTSTHCMLRSWPFAWCPAQQPPVSSCMMHALGPWRTIKPAL